MALGTVTVRTTLLPPIVVDLEGTGGEPSAVAKLLRPSVEVRSPLGSWTSAPYGDPGESTWPWGAVLLVVALGVGVVLLMRAGARVRW